MFEIISAPHSLKYKEENGKYFIKASCFAVSGEWGEITRERYLQAKKEHENGKK